MQKIKGSSSHFINHLPEVQANITLCLYWQPGYGWMTYAKNELPRVIGYVDNQKTHHAEGRLWEKLERDLQPASAGFPMALARDPSGAGRDDALQSISTTKHT